MKRLFTTLLLLSTLCIGTNYASCDNPSGTGNNGGSGSNGGNNGGGNNGGGTGINSGGINSGSIDIDDIVCPPGPGGRSLTRTVEAYADSFDAQIEIIFNRDLGTVTAAVIDSDGYVISSTECDTSFIDVVYLSLPTQPGFYTLRINSREYLGEGVFEL